MGSRAYGDLVLAPSVPSRVRWWSRRPGATVGGAAVAVTALVVSAYGVALSDIVAFAAYVLLALTLPGTLIWRALYGHGMTRAVEFAAGTAVGYALEVPVYIAARAAGAPVLVLAFPVATITAFLVRPRLRRCWKRAGDEGRSSPVWWTASLAGLFCFVLLFSGVGFFATHDLPELRFSYLDMPYHLALAGEIKQHVPPADPFVAGGLLRYHWFVYCDIAATSWVTGIDLETLVLRLSVLPMVAVFMLLLAVIAVRATGRTWAGPVAVGAAFLIMTPNPLSWTAGLVPSGALLDGTLWVSPTQTFGAMLGALAVLLLTSVIKGNARAGVWVLLGVVLLALTGAKATYLPLFAAGLAVVVLHPRTRSRAAAIALAAVVSALGLAHLVLFGGVNLGLRLEPLTALSRALGHARIVPPAADPGPQVMVLMLVVTLLSWACVWYPALWVLAVRRPRDPLIVWLAAVGAAGIAATLLLGHPGGSEYFFLQSVRPYLAVLAVCGLAAALPAGRLTVSPAGPLLAGALVVGGVRLVAGEGRVWPYLLLGAVLAALAVVVRLVVSSPAARLPLVFGVLAGAGLTFSPERAARAFEMWPLASHAVPPGIQQVGRWLRDNSGPDDLVATNAHCLEVRRDDCDTRHSWVSGFSQRRVLVEGWGMSANTLAAVPDITRNPLKTVPFWDRERLAANDAAFDDPSRAAVALLRDRYGVRWLVADEHRDPDSARLAGFARYRMQAGSWAVYELTPPSTRS